MENNKIKDFEKGVTLKLNAKDKWEVKTLYQIYNIWKKIENKYGSDYLKKYLEGYDLTPKPLTNKEVNK